jgi:hypothetical protein
MAKDGIIIKLDDAGNPVLKQRKDEAELDYYVDNKKADLESYTDMVLTASKFTASAEPGSAANAQTGAPADAFVIPTLKNNHGQPSNTYIAAESRDKIERLNMILQEQ